MLSLSKSAVADVAKKTDKDTPCLSTRKDKPSVSKRTDVSLLSWSQRLDNRQVNADIEAARSTTPLRDMLMRNKPKRPDWWVDPIDGQWICNGCNTSFDDKGDWMKHAQGQRRSWGPVSCPYSYESMKRARDQETTAENFRDAMQDPKRRRVFDRFEKVFGGKIRELRERWEEKDRKAWLRSIGESTKAPRPAVVRSPNSDSDFEDVPPNGSASPNSDSDFECVRPSRKARCRVVIE